MTQLMTKLTPHTVSFGCDPEFFFEKKGKIIGSEKIIDLKKGMKVTGTNSKIIVDGVQAELNPQASTCRQVLAGEISQAFIQLQREMQKDPEMSISFLPTVKMDKTELDTLDEKSRVFGCAPSKSITKKPKAILRDPKKYMYRSAGGHIHIGAASGMPVGNSDWYGNSPAVNIVLSEPARIIAIMDIIVGNTCVLIDRDPSNVERRKVYGRAGEYRTPPHGLEYRTLSNFWLRSYPMMSFVMSLARMSVSVLANTMPGRDFERELHQTVSLAKCQKAINTNDFKLAWENFQDLKVFICRFVDELTGFPITPATIETFEFFVEKGLDHWFKENPMEHWINLGGRGTNAKGWESFLKDVVKPEMVMEDAHRKPAPNVK